MKNFPLDELTLLMRAHRRENRRLCHILRRQSLRSPQARLARLRIRELERELFRYYLPQKIAEKWM